MYFEPFFHPASPFLAHSIPLVQGLKESHQWKLSCLHVLVTKSCASPPISQNGEILTVIFLRYELEKRLRSVYWSQQAGDSKDDDDGDDGTAI